MVAVELTVTVPVAAAVMVEIMVAVMVVVEVTCGGPRTWGTKDRGANLKMKPAPTV